MAKTFAKKYLFLIFAAILILFLVIGIVLFSQSTNKKNKVKKETRSLETIIIEPSQKHSATVIFLHGLGDNARNQQNICQPLAEKHPHIKFIIPQAPTISDEQGLLNSVSQIKKIIQGEINSGIAAAKIMVVGHSQGASVALAVGLTSDYRLAAKEENKTILFFLYHTYHNDIIPVDIGSQSAQLLKGKGYQVEFDNYYNGGHFFRPEKLQEIMTKKLKELLKKVLEYLEKQAIIPPGYYNLAVIFTAGFASNEKE
ncbi:13980_t:CDS:2 [Entrophospora sp. SA101]|nr:13980_t:CDS:2 [Entrophospora sp. SA101]